MAVCLCTLVLRKELAYIEHGPGVTKSVNSPNRLVAPATSGAVSKQADVIPSTNSTLSWFLSVQCIIIIIII